MSSWQEQIGDALPSGFVLSNRYKVERFLGSGAMGAVHLVQDLLLDGNLVAVKVLHREYSRDRERTQRFIQEVKLMHLVNHPNVVRTYDVGKDHDLIYFTMEYIPGITLDELARTGEIEVAHIANFAVQIAQGLEAIHRAGIVHRDLKPGNIIVDVKGTAKISDFGVAQSLTSSFVDKQEIVGSIQYMAPEALEGKELSPAVDFYSLGVILYELATGKVPFESDHPAALMYMHLGSNPVAPARLRPDLPSRLNDLILGLLAKSPFERPRTLREITNYLYAKEKKSNKATNTDVPPKEEAPPLEQTACNSLIFTRTHSLEEIEEAKSRRATPIVAEETNEQEASGTHRSSSLDRLQRFVYVFGLLAIIAASYLFALIYLRASNRPYPSPAAVEVDENVLRLQTLEKNLAILNQRTQQEEGSGK